MSKIGNQYSAYGDPFQKSGMSYSHGGAGGSGGPKDLEERFCEMKRLLKGVEDSYQEF